MDNQNNAETQGEPQFRPQNQNINQHTERGMEALEQSIRGDGWIGAVTVAADGEAFAGSARLQKSEELGLTRTIVVDTDGTERIILRRTDIPTATDPRARRLGINDNRVQQLDYNPDAVLLAQAKDEGLLMPVMYFHQEIEELLHSINKPDGDTARPEPGGGGDEFLNQEMPVREPLVKPGEVWKIGPHFLMCGSATSVTDRDTLLRTVPTAPVLVLTDPPYNIGKDYADGVDDNMTSEEYYSFNLNWFDAWANIAKVIMTPGGQNLQKWMEWSAEMVSRLADCAPWVKLNAMSGGRVSAFNVWEPILFFGGAWKRTRASNVFNHRVTEQTMADGVSLTGLHPCPKPVSLWSDLIESYTDEGDIVADPMCGLGTTMISCHRTNRIALMMDISPTYCDLIIDRAVAEGIGPIEKVVSSGHDTAATATYSGTA